MSAQIIQCTEAQYHADPCPFPSLSSSIASTMLDNTPLHAWSKHPKLGGDPYESTPAQDDGKILHALILGEGAAFEIIEADSYRTNAAKDARDDAIRRGVIPILEAKFPEYRKTADRILENCQRKGIELEGQSEVTIVWEEVGRHGPVLCRCRLDLLNLERGIIRDIKKSRSIAPYSRERAAVDYGMAVQAAAYTSAVTKLDPDLRGRLDFRFLFFEDQPPYDAVLCPITGAFEMYGESRWMRAVSQWEECLRSSRWPGYPNEPLDVPAWAMAKEELAAEEAG